MRTFILAAALACASTACMKLETARPQALSPLASAGQPVSVRRGPVPSPLRRPAFAQSANERVAPAEDHTDLILKGVAGVVLGVAVFLYVD